MLTYLFFGGKRSQGHRQLHHHGDNMRRVNNDARDFGIDRLGNINCQKVIQLEFEDINSPKTSNLRKCPSLYWSVLALD